MPFRFSDFLDFHFHEIFQRKLIDEFWSFDDDDIITEDLIDDSFLYQFFIFLYPIHIHMQDFFVVDIDIRVGRALDFLFVDSQAFRKSFGQQSLPRTEFSVEEEYFML